MNGQSSQNNRILTHFKDLKFYKQGDEYVIIYEGERLFAHKGEYVRQFIDDLMTRPQTAKEVKKLKQLAHERRLAYVEFVTKVSRNNLQKLYKHILKGDVKLTTFRRRGRIENASGMHNANAIFEGNVELIDNIKIPPHPRYNEPFEAYIRVKNPSGTFVNKLSQSGKLQYSTFFPEGWNVERIKEEIAFAWKNKVPDTNPSFFYGNSTDGIKVKFIIRNNEILTVHPVK